jgi:hypothetical protein
VLCTAPRVTAGSAGNAGPPDLRHAVRFARLLGTTCESEERRSAGDRGT